MGYGPEETENKVESKQVIQPIPKHRLGDVIKYYDEKRKGIHHFGEIIQVSIRKEGVFYHTQDHAIVKEVDVKASFYESPF